MGKLKRLGAWMLALAMMLSLCWQPMEVKAEGEKKTLKVTVQMEGKIVDAGIATITAYYGDYRYDNTGEVEKIAESTSGVLECEADSEKLTSAGSFSIAVKVPDEYYIIDPDSAGKASFEHSFRYSSASFDEHSDMKVEIEKKDASSEKKSISVNVKNGDTVVTEGVTLSAYYTSSCKECHATLSKDKIAESTNGVLECEYDISKLTATDKVDKHIFVEAKLARDNDLCFPRGDDNSSDYKYDAWGVGYDDWGAAGVLTHTFDVKNYESKDTIEVNAQAEDVSFKGKCSLCSNDKFEYNGIVTSARIEIAMYTTEDVSTKIEETAKESSNGELNGYVIERSKLNAGQRIGITVSLPDGYKWMYDDDGSKTRTEFLPLDWVGGGNKVFYSMSMTTGESISGHSGSSDNASTTDKDAQTSTSSSSSSGSSSSSSGGGTIQITSSGSAVTASAARTFTAATDANASISDTSGVLPATTVMTTAAVTDAATLSTITEALKGEIPSDVTIGQISAMNIDLSDSATGAEIHALNGKVAVTVPVPFSIGNGNMLSVIRVNDDGTMQLCESSMANGKVTFMTDHFSTYIFVEASKAVSFIGGAAISKTAISIKAGSGRPTATSNNNRGAEGTRSASPKTSDEGRRLPIAGAALLVIAMIGFVSYRKKGIR